MDKNINSQRYKKYDYEYANDYNFSVLDYNELDTFNQPNDLQKLFTIKIILKLSITFMKLNLYQIISCITSFREVVRNILTHKTKII